MFLDVYNAANSTETESLWCVSRAADERTGKPATKFFDFVLTDIQSQPVPHLTFAQYLQLANLAAGRYQAMIETKDMVTRKSTKQEASFEIVP
jgi:hypothetical protein